MQTPHKVLVGKVALNVLMKDTMTYCPVWASNHQPCDYYLGALTDRAMSPLPLYNEFFRYTL